MLLNRSISRSFLKHTQHRKAVVCVEGAGDFFFPVRGVEMVLRRECYDAPIKKVERKRVGSMSLGKGRLRQSVHVDQIAYLRCAQMSKET